MSKDLLSGNAYRVFVNEVDKHLKQVAASLAGGAEPSAEDTRAMSGSFHTIKGAAGFFGLQELGSLAGELEEKLLRDDFSWESQGEATRAQVERLVELVQKLPSAES